MKKRIRTLFQSRHVMITVMLIIGFCIFIFWGIQKTFGENKIIDLNGNNAYWKASLNINLGTSMPYIQTKLDFLNSETLCLSLYRIDWAPPMIILYLKV